MERGFLTLYKEHIYDADVACKRGEKKGNAYVNACYLDTREYTFDGERMVQTRRERMVPRSGNRFLSETYRDMSLHSAILRGGHF